MTIPNSAISRRRLLALAGGTTASLASLALLASDPPRPSSTSISTASKTASAAPGQPDCVLTPKEIEGPFYTDVDLMRSNIIDGRAGYPLEMRFTVIDATSCAPIVDASVDVWHADAQGLYSAFPEQGDDANIDTSKDHFLRGVQTTDRDGTAVFDTIYPGWYEGRTTHVHVKVHLGDRTAVTTQFFFPDTVSSEIYRQAPYRTRGQKDTKNNEDDFSATLEPLRFSIERAADRVIATRVIGVRRTT